MKRRTAVQIGLGVAAAAAGAGVSWWRSQPAGIAPVPAALWALRLPRHQGGELALDGLRGRPLLINFWATWCPPCVKELPEIDRFAREEAAQPGGWQVVGIAIDKLDAVQSFLKTTPVGYPIGLAGYAVTELTRALGNDAGGLPFTVAIDAAGALSHRKLGPTDYLELQGWAGNGT